MYFWNKVPFLRLLIPFLIGIIAAVYMECPVYFFRFLIVFLFFLLLFFLIVTRFINDYRYRLIFGFFLNLFLFLAGYEWTINNTEKFKAGHFSNLTSGNAMVMAQVAEAPVEKEKSIKTVLEIIAKNNAGNWVATTGNVLVYLQNDSLRPKIEYGDRLLLETGFDAVTVPQNPFEFDYRRYLSFHQVYHQVYVKAANWRVIPAGGTNSLIRYSHALRNKLLEILKANNVSDKELAVASALMLGYKDDLDNEIKRSYSGTGAMHVLAVSGLHVGIIFIVFNSLLFFLDKIKWGNIIKAVILILLLWCYAFLTGLSPSVLRAATMFSFIIAGQAFKHHTNIYNTLSVSAFFLLLFNPYLIMEVGFQLSYLAVIGIVYLQPKIYNLWESKYWLSDKIWGLTAVSISAQIATFPLGLLYFHQFPNYFLLSNLLVIPLATLIIYVGVLLLVFSPIKVVAGFIGKVLNGLIAMLNESVFWIEKLPYSLSEGISISILETWLIYLVIILTAAFLTFKRAGYFLATLSMLIIFTALNLFENFGQLRQKRIIVYNISNTSALNFIGGRDNLFFSDSTLIHNADRLLFHVRNNWINNGVENEKMIDLNYLKSRGEDCKRLLKDSEGRILVRENFMQFYDKRILLINGPLIKSIHAKKLKLDYVVLSKNAKVNIKEILSTMDCATIIIDASNSFYRTQHWINECEALKVNCYPVALKGAFVVDLRNL